MLGELRSPHSTTQNILRRLYCILEEKSTRRSTWTWDRDDDGEICECDAVDAEYLCGGGTDDDCDGVSQVYGDDGSSQSDPSVLAGAGWEGVDDILGRRAAISAIAGPKDCDADVKWIPMV